MTDPNQQKTESMFGSIVEQSIEQEITQSYIDYAMSVIVTRALPDTRDGFKPVLRRILYAMWQLGLKSNAKYRKSATVVGEVLGKYHPHGDSSVYEAMVRLAQPRVLRYPLVDGQGNFGSIDGDGAAAMRYTEAKLTKIAEEMLEDIDQDTVDRKPNFDGSLQEPTVLPTKFPNHLCNGTMGIAVGMATNMAPHNLTEVLDACILLIQKEGKKQPDGSISTVEIPEIMQIIKGPDFPTGGYIFDSTNILEVYTKGKGSIVVRGKTHVQQTKHGAILVIDEIPYTVNKASLVAKIGELVVDKKIDGITDIRDESNKDGMRIAIYLRNGVDPDKILIQLYKLTELQTNYSINNVSLIDNGLQPNVLNIKDLLREFIQFRRTVIYRRSSYQLKKAKERLHILEGLKKAIDMIDTIIDTIKKSSTKAEAKDRLMAEFNFSAEQAEYILLMRLQSLVGLEIQNIIDEIQEKTKLIVYLQDIIDNPESLDTVLIQECEYMKQHYGDNRRTQVINDTSVYDLASSLKALRDAADKQKEDVILRISNNYQIRILYQSRIMNIPEETMDLIYTHNQDKLIIITDQAELVVQRLKDFGQFTMQKEPLDLKSYYQLKGNIVFAKTLHFDYTDLVFLTNHNNIKKTKKELVLSFKKFPTTIMKLADQEKIVSIIPVSENDVIGIVTQNGYLLLFPENNLRTMGKTAGGVKAIELEENDTVVNMFVYKKEPFILVYSNKKGKLLSIEDLRIQKRYKKGQKVTTTVNPIQGAISIEEGAIRIKYTDGSIQTLHSNNIPLDIPESPLYDITTKNIEIIYRPWEEVKENMKYKEEKKKHGSQTTETNTLFTSINIDSQ